MDPNKANLGLEQNCSLGFIIFCISKRVNFHQQILCPLQVIFSIAAEESNAQIAHFYILLCLVATSAGAY